MEHIDRIPTDKESNLRPIVMVRNSESEPWQKKELLYVRETSETPFWVRNRNGGIDQFKFGRHLRSDESPSPEYRSS